MDRGGLRAADRGARHRNVLPAGGGDRRLHRRRRRLAWRQRAVASRGGQRARDRGRGAGASLARAPAEGCARLQLPRPRPARDPRGLGQRSGPHRAREVPRRVVGREAQGSRPAPGTGNDALYRGPRGQYPDPRNRSARALITRRPVVVAAQQPTTGGASMLWKTIIAVIVAIAAAALTHSALATVATFLVAMIIVFIFEGVRIVPQQQAWVVERLGNFHPALEPGLNPILPFFAPVPSPLPLTEA